MKISKQAVGLYFAVFIFISTKVALCNDLKHIVLMETMPVHAVLESTHWFKVQLKDMGYIEGKNLKLTILTPNGDRNQADLLLRRALNEKKPDIVVANATLASQVAARVLEGTNIPLVFLTVGAPVKAGLVEEIGKPTGTNITGKPKMLPVNTRLTIVSRLLKKKTGGATITIGYIYPTYPSSEANLQKLLKESKQFEQIKIIPYKVQYRKVPSGMPGMIADTIAAMDSLKDVVDYWWESAGPLGESPEYTTALQKHSSKPIVFGHRMDSVEKGALVSIVVSLESNGRETAIIADKILKGTPPGMIPVSPPSSFRVGVNLTTASKLKIVIPMDILKLAGKHVYR